MPLIYGQSMLYFGQKFKKNDHPKLRSLPGHASVIYQCYYAKLECFVTKKWEKWLPNSSQTGETLHAVT